MICELSPNWKIKHIPSYCSDFLKNSFVLIKEIHISGPTNGGCPSDPDYITNLNLSQPAAAAKSLQSDCVTP